MKRNRLAVLTFLLAGSLSMPLHAETPCAECLQQTLSKLSACLASAKSDEDKSACNMQAIKENEACQKGVCKNEPPPPPQPQTLNLK
jgi:hypothetical protein